MMSRSRFQGTEVTIVTGAFSALRKSKSSLHLLLKHENVKSQWLQFIFTVTPQQHNPKLYFTHDCFLNLGEVNAGFAKRLFIKDGTVPTLFGPSCASESQLVSICIIYVICSTECPNCVCVVCKPHISCGGPTIT